MGTMRRAFTPEFKQEAVRQDSIRPATRARFYAHPQFQALGDQVQDTLDYDAWVEPTRGPREWPR